MGRIPDCKEYMIALYLSRQIEWDAREHEDWELPPIEAIRDYLEQYPLDTP